MRLRERAVVKILFLLSAAAVTGVVVAAAVLPFAATAGALAKAGVDTYDRLPSNFVSLPTPQTSLVYANDGHTLLARFYDENRQDVPLSAVAPIMQESIVASEDSRFYEHHGVDFKGVARAAVSNSDGAAQGASTLTMQYVRQSMIYSAPTQQDVIAASEKTPARKVREMKLALALEKKLTKPQILERYLNIAPFGHGSWGIAAASHVYFNKEPKDLTLGEAALLAGLVQAPSEYDPLDATKLPAALQRREHVFAQLIRMGKITSQQAEDARRAPLHLSTAGEPEGCEAAQLPDIDTGFVCDYLYRWWLQQPAFGPDPLSRENRLKSGGYRIVSSMDVNVQRSMKKNIEARIHDTDRRALMLAAVEPSSGRVLALATNRNFSIDESGNRPNPNPYKRGQKGTFPNTTNPLMSGGGDVTGYMAGSTFKLFTMVAALEQGIPLSNVINTVPQYHSKYKTAPTDKSACPGTDDWCPVNASKSEAGAFNMWEGYGKSVNTYFVPLEERVGAANAVAVAQKMGIQFYSDGDRRQAQYADGWGTFTLGVSGTTPLDLVSAYSTIANDGVHCAPTPVVDIHDFNGAKVADASATHCNQAIPADVAHAAADAARCPVGDHGGTGHCAGATAGDTAGIVGHPVLGKTGTTDTNETATLVAMTRQVAVAGIEADTDWPHDTTADHGQVNVAVQRTLRDAMRGKPSINFPLPPSRLIGNPQKLNPSKSPQPGQPGQPVQPKPPGRQPQH